MHFVLSSTTGLTIQCVNRFSSNDPERQSDGKMSHHGMFVSLTLIGQVSAQLLVEPIK